MQQNSSTRRPDEALSGGISINERTIIPGNQKISKLSRIENSGAKSGNRIVSRDRGENKKPIHKGDKKQQEYIDYAWEISHEPNFIYLLKAENGLITPDRKHALSYKLCDNSQGITVPPSNCYAKKKGYYWKTHWDWGFCGASDGYQKNTVEDARFFTNWKWQLDQCYRLYKGGTTFYGIKRFRKDKIFRNKIINSFTWTT